MEDHSNPFWQYSLKLYARKEIAGLCLRLQDEGGLDVNLLLYCLWQGSQGRSLERTTLAEVCDVSAPWRLEVVESLRHARRWMKGRDQGIAGQSGDLRDRIKALELAAEKCQQDWLASRPAAYDSAPPVIAAAHNLSGYVQEAQAPSTPVFQDTMVHLLRQAFPDAAAECLSKAEHLLASPTAKLN